MKEAKNIKKALHDYEVRTKLTTNFNYISVNI